MTSTAKITVTAKSWDEARGDELPQVVRAEFRTDYRGDAEGSSTSWLLITYTDGDLGDASSLIGAYIGYEQFSGSLAGRTGSFVLEERGAHTGAVARTTVQVVPGSGTDELAGLTGSGSYAADAMEYTLTLDYDFE